MKKKSESLKNWGKRRSGKKKVGLKNRKKNKKDNLYESRNGKINVSENLIEIKKQTHLNLGEKKRPEQEIENDKK